MYNTAIKPIYENGKCVGYRYFLNEIPVAQSYWNGQKIVGFVRADYQEVIFFENFRPMPIEDFNDFISILEVK